MAVESPNLPPEGGLTGWLTVLGGFFITFCSFGTAQSFGVYQDYYAQTLLPNYSLSDISWIGSAQLFFLFFTGLPAGKLFDTGHFRECLVFGCLLFVFSTFMLSLVQQSQYYQVFLAQAMGTGIASGFMFAPALSVVSHYFTRRRSLAMGIVMSGSCLGAIIYPIMLNNLFNGKVGFAWGVRATAFMDIGLLAFANVIMKAKPKSSKRPGLEQDGFGAIMRDVPYWLNTLGCGCMFIGVFVPVFYIQLFTQMHGLSPSLSFYTISILNAASLFGRILPNFVADMYVLIVCTALTGALTFVMLAATTVAGAVVFTLLYGFFSGSSISLATPAAASFSKSLGEVGVRIGLGTLVAGVASLIGPPIAGALVQSHGSYQWYRPVVFAAVSCVLLVC
ncbi:MFS general substrate transporter [Coniophora puteana RWD-64-598 SS2]|uniref:MFS general substrate transporter n=1 Tax=Coniophora puteana (strain RWD-64-598) TaxID=741705 RepID=R7SFC7_CONPW|nr:MFS general substrate transporter [Coniophora puteana RWD-64-598 SS2]EIW74580.1 MFS general substrate transporter [Coniophora puteana RWD-64-598 SS2]